MLEPPNIPDDAVHAALEAHYGLRVASLEFLPLGADLGTAVYRAAAADGRDYFAKLRFGPFNEVAARVPRLLGEAGIEEVMAPMPARSGHPFAVMSGFTLLVYPFVDGRDAYEVTLSDGQWVAFGRAMRRVHDAQLPPELARRVPFETFDGTWRDQLRRFVGDPGDGAGLDTPARRYAAFLVERRGQLLDLLDRTDRLAALLAAGASGRVLCHTDLHPGNLLFCPDGRLFIVDWDAPLLAPRERDLMYPGGAQGFPGRSPDEEEALFYEGYGPVEVDPKGLAYYRLERMIEDLAVFAVQLLSPGTHGAGQSEAEREQAFGWAMSNFLPGHVLETADDTYRRAVAGA